MEGATRLFPPTVNLKGAGPGRKEKGAAFYNPGMALNRDLSVLLVEAYAAQRGREIDVADALAGTGARAVRLAHEVAAPVIVHANDRDPAAITALRKAAAQQRIAKARLQATQGDAHVFLAARKYDVVDIDPCGSPMPFLDAGLRAVRHDGLLCITATDTGALAGTFPRVCLRRYGAEHFLHSAAWRSEVGLRILAGAIVRSAARFDRVATPVLSVCHGHWMRIVARIEDGRKDADAAVRHLRDAEIDEATGNGRWLDARAPRPLHWGGPMWAGPLHDEAVVVAMADRAGAHTLARARAMERLLPILRDECAAAPFFVVPDRLQKRLGAPSPRRDALIERLRGAGFRAARTHLDPQGVRTDADLAGLRAEWAGARTTKHE